MVKAGWRKLTAWFLVFAATYTTLWLGWDMTPITADVIKFVTLLLVAGNAVEHTTGAASVIGQVMAIKKAEKP